MSDRKWYSGEPPHIGWWVASNRYLHHAWRWWDGKVWSSPAFDYYDADKAGFYAAMEDHTGYELLWTNYYPENARVPRIDPRRQNAKDR